MGLAAEWGVEAGGTKSVIVMTGLMAVKETTRLELVEYVGVEGEPH